MKMTDLTNKFNSLDKAQLHSLEKQLTLTVKGLSVAVTTILLGSCVSQPTVKPNQGKTQTTTIQQPQVIAPTTNTSKNSHTIVGGQANKQTAQAQTGTQVVLPRPTVPSQPQVQTPTTVQTPSTQGQSYGSFYDWQQDFLRRSGGAGQVVNNAHLNSTAIRLDKNQAEFNTAIWSYVDARTKSSIVSQGQAKRSANIALFDRNEAQYGVPASIVTAIWGVETGYGGNMGSMSVVDALSSLAFDGRRQAWAEGQLIAFASLVNNGDVSSYMTGSHAGAMGHTQFMPKTWQDYGVDGDGDGRRNPTNAADALTSTSNYLAKSGWIRGLPAYIEVGLPSNFDYRHIGQKYSLDQWRSLGLNGYFDSVSGNYPAELWLPAGINGPALLITPNFDVIKVYNNSSNYALTVAVLAQKINGRVGIQASFPRNEQMLTKTQAMRLQQNLSAQGYNVGTPDGIIGTNTRKAFAQWQLANGKIPDGFISVSSAGGLIY